MKTLSNQLIPRKGIRIYKNGDVKVKIRWTNKYSGEQGYVKCIKKSAGYFENTFDKAEAKSYSPKSVKQTINQLDGLCADNTYEAVEEDTPDGSKVKVARPP